MNLKELKIEEITNLENYYNIFGDISFFESNDLLVNDYTSFIYDDVERCNRKTIKNYLALINLLFDNFDYIVLEVSAQLSIIDRIKTSLMPKYEEYREEVESYDDSSTNNWAADWEAKQDYQRAYNRLNSLQGIKNDLDEIYNKLVMKLDDELNTRKH